jgi:8-amino-7-oxononanoate synthase
MPTAIDLFEKARRHERLEQLQAAREHDLLPYFRVVEAEPGPVALMEGRERITLGSNNYLGLTGDERVKQAARDALETYGTGLTGSRFMNGTTPLHLELERELADWMGTPDAIVYTTGFLANTGCIGTLLEPGDTVICDSGDHASILDAASMSRARIRPFRHGRLDKLEAMLRRAEGDGGGVLVVVDGVFSMEGDLAPLPDIVALCREHGARLMVDEAHGVGVLGARGVGACEAFDCEDEVDLRMGTFSKSLASCGGFVAGPADVIDFLRVQSRSFMFTAAAVPAAVGAALGALRIIRSDDGQRLMARVLDNARYLHSGLAELGYRVKEPTRMPGGSELITPIVPVLVGEDWQAVMLWKALYDAGVYVNVAIYPAVPRGGALLRTSVMATHEREHLDRALAVFEGVRRELPDAPPAAAPPEAGDGVGR